MVVSECMFGRVCVCVCVAGGLYVWGRTSARGVSTRVHVRVY